MHEVLAFLILHGYIALMLWVFVEQIGVPLPAAPVLLAAGALAGTGLLNGWVSAGTALMAALVSDLIWFQIGRVRGNTVLGLLCRISLEPASCARRTQNMFSRHGASSLLLAKFIPWLNTAASPLAGAFGMRLFTFLLFDTLGILLWITTFLGLGYLFSNELDQIAAYASKFGFVFLAILLSVALAAYLGRRYTRQQQFLRQLRMARITAEELKQKMDSKEDLAIIDLRHPLEFLPEPFSIPGSIRFSMEELEHRHLEIPRDRDVVLYCTCPSEATSAMTAMRLRQFGITRVRPLAGGYFAWRKCGFPLEPHSGPVQRLRLIGDYTRSPVTP